jgi:Tol biopolymer transport system component
MVRRKILGGNGMESALHKRLWPVLTILVLSIGIFFSTSEAQYFGRNKVQYERFDFKVLSTEHFDIYFYPEEEKAATMAARLAERWYERLSRILNHDLRGRQPLILYSSSPHFQQTTAIPGVIGEGTGGVTEMFKRRIVLPLGASLGESDHVIGHELVHAFQFDITSQSHPRYATAAPTALRLPLWFIEGLAEYLSIGAVDPHTSMWMRDVTRREKLPPIKKLTNPRYFPYRYGQSLWAYITGRWGDKSVERIMKGVSRAGDYEQVIKRVLDVDLKTLSKDWHESLKKSYTPLAQKTKLMESSSRVLFKGTEKNVLNISPALSPNGKQIVFLSTKDLFSIDLFLADALTGKIERKLVTTAVDPHFESLQFIKSAGCWDAQGKRFVFAAVSKGQPVLTVLNVERGRIEREIVFPEMGEILNPTWSPDGRFLAFSALVGGLTDLFLYDLETQRLKRMSDDPFADLYPAWSPDGHWIAFSTDRFSTDLSILSIGNYELALMDPDTGEIEKIPAFSEAKNINPQWSSDGRSLYFISDQNGISNVYRIDIQSREIYQVTNLFTGVSGITDLSPALSIAQKEGQMAYCVYEEDRYSIYSIDSPENTRGQDTLVQFEEIRPSVLPPRTKPEGELLGLLKNPLFGLPEEADYEIRDYKPKLTLDYVSPPQLAIGVDRYGTYGGGGIALFFSDMLGYHNVVSMLQVSSRLEDSAALVGYQNSSSRLNWGAVAQRIPYVSAYYGQTIGEVFGELAIIQQEEIFRQINYQLSGFTFYPFSQVQRFELSAGYRFIDFDWEVRTRAYSYYTGREIIDEKEDLPTPDGLHLGFASAALVYDSSFFGATSPILGQAYRLEVSPFLGSLGYYTMLADYRRYIMPVKPFTLAFRLLHYGRYGKDAEDSRLYPVFLGYESLVRGYNSGSFDFSEFGEGGFDYNRLFGSKLLVANFELRFPLFQVLGIGKGYYGIFPSDFIAFFDTGVAWTKDEEPDLFGLIEGSREFLSSVGVGLRTNLFGYLILGVNYVNPLSRPDKGGYFQFTITPGF